MKYPRPQDNYSCEVLCDNFHEVEHRLQGLEQKDCCTRAEVEEMIANAGISTVVLPSAEGVGF